MNTDQALAAEEKRRTAYLEGRAFIDRTGKATPLPPKVLDPPKKGYRTTYSCRRCGAGVSEAHWHYCPNCGQTIMHASFAGARGWSQNDAEKIFREMMEVDNDN